MNALLNWAGLLLLVVLVGHKAATYQKRWTWGPKYHMPVSLLAPDGKHFADGTLIDPGTMLVLRTGNQEEVWLGIMGLLVVGGLMLAKSFREGSGKGIDEGLDQGLLKWNRHDSMRRRDVLNGGVLIMGRPGSGKTSASGATIARALVRDPLCTMLILCAKPEDKLMWQRIFAEKKRELLVFEPGGSLRCNVIEVGRRMGWDTREIVSFLTTSAEALQRDSSSSSGREDGEYFKALEGRFFHCGVEVLKQAQIPISCPNLQQFITGAAMSEKQLKSERWREGIHNQCLRKAIDAKKTATERHDLQLAIDAWVKEWPAMAEKTRSCVLAGMLNTLFHFNTGVARELMATTTNCSPLDMLQGGKSILVNCPSCEYGDSGTMVSSSWKFLMQKAVLGRKFNGFYNIIWADEAWQVTTSFDQHYLNTSRSHGGAMVYLVQSMNSFYAALGPKKIAFANGIMSAFHHKIFHALGSAEDAEYAASHLGKIRELFVSGSTQPYKDVFDGFLGNNQFTASTSEQYQPILQPKVFLSDLRSGGRENNYLADAIVVRTGEPFKSTGQNFIYATFSQK